MPALPESSRAETQPPTDRWGHRTGCGGWLHRGSWGPWRECPDPAEVLLVAPTWPEYVTATRDLYLDAGVPATIAGSLPGI